jgi:hypothetical protein
MKGYRSVLLRAGVGVILTTAALRAAEAPDLSKVDRRIAKEPKYVSKEPLYGLYVFGPEAKTHVWAVLDKSKPDSPEYDVLYFDRNANGDLTESGQRIAGKSNGQETTFEVGSFTDPATGHTHTKLTIARYSGPQARVFLRMRWNDKVEVMGGYAEEPGPYTQFATRPQEAPVLWPSADGPLSFQRWGEGRLTIGGADDLRVFLGHRGQGRNTFCGLPQTFLPNDVPVLATVIYTDAAGKERRVQSELKERC